MKYPRFLKSGDTIGITALSSGTGNDIKEVKISLNHLKEDYHLIITPDVYKEKIVSSSVSNRIKEFNDLLKEDIKGLFNIRGGDFCNETLDGLNFKKIVQKRILAEGFSDITSLVYILTTKYDYLTLYGFNAKSFDNNVLAKYQLVNLEFLKGNFIRQESYNDRHTISLNGDFQDKGILIGGCLDVLRYLFGTCYDKTKKFIKKYQNYKIIWYFDIFMMDSIDVYLTLLQMKRMGYFDYSKTILIGSIYSPKEKCNLSYKEVYKKVFIDKNIIIDANIGHVGDSFTMVNGSLAYVEYKDNKMILEQELLDKNI